MNKFVWILIIVLLPLFSFAQHAYEGLIDVKHYTIDLDISDFTGKTISGNTILNLATTEDNVSTIYLYLLKLNVDSIVCNDYEISSFSYNDSIITINFETAPEANQPFDLNIFYNGAPKKDPSGWGGFYFSGDYAFNMGCGFQDVPHNYGRVWFPCNDNFTDKAKYTTIITTQAENTAISSGELVDVQTDEESGKTTYRWELTQEVPTYLQSVAVGPYYHHHHVYHGISRDIPVDIYGYPNDSAKITGSFYRLDTTLRVYENLFGEYPWQRVGYVLVNFSSGAMEHVGNISIGRSFVTSGPDVYETLYYHELSHHWFGDLVTCATAEDMWLNEGWATYCETLWKEFVCGENDGRTYRHKAHYNVLTKTYRDDGYMPLTPFPVDNTYSSTVYDKGASVVHTLRNYLGDDVFFETIRAYLAEYSYKNATSYQFRDFLTQHTGIDMTPFFDSWVFTKGFPHFSIDSAVITPNGGNYDVTVYIRQKMLERENFTDANRIEITFMKSDFTTETKVLEFSGETGNQTFTIPFEPALVMCDYFEHTADATIDQALTLNSGDNYTFSKTDCTMFVNEIEGDAMVRITCNYVAPDDFAEQVEGLEIVPGRYWLVESIRPNVFSSQLKITFNCTGAGGWEKPYIQSSMRDSISLVYRRDRSEDWRIIPAQYSKPGQQFTIENFPDGEYALAIRNGYNGIGKLSESSFSVYPNPANEILNISFGTVFNGNVAIVDMNGKELLHKKVKATDVELNLKHLTAGTYIVVVRDKNGMASRKIEVK
ncbi:MAG: T9SS type A sorting domain-containing protein [Bacteroidales bacterium]|nr:T9SS type A sorting domain-containing protein [Bacteroidales bacterium]